jgi:hypothetical protein
VSKHHSLRAGFGVTAAAALVLVGSAMPSAADILHFAPLDNAAAVSGGGSQPSWQWPARINNASWIWRIGDPRGGDPANPPEAQAPIHYDYPSYGPGVAGSSLSFIVGKRHRRDDLRPPPHAE